MSQETAKGETAEGPKQFFNAMRNNFAQILAQGRGDPRLIDVLAAQAGDNYEKNAEIQSEGLPAHACGKGCETCCCLQVAATAPEIFHAAHFIRLTAQAFAAHGVDLAQRLRQSQAMVAGKSDLERFISRAPCPLIIGGACAIYAARPLACRGHVSFDRDACVAAARGATPKSPRPKSTRPYAPSCRTRCRRRCATRASPGAPMNSLLRSTSCCRTRNARRNGGRARMSSPTCNSARSSRPRWRRVLTPCATRDRTT